MKRDGDPCTASAIAGERWCYHHHPAYAEERRRNASRAATLGNSKIGAEIRSTRLMVRELLEVTLSGNFDPIVRKRLAEVVQLVQSYCRLVKLELASVEAPRFPGKGYVALPENTIERAKEWAEVEAEREKQREAFTGKLRALEKDPRVALEAME